MATVTDITEDTVVTGEKFKKIDKKASAHPVLCCLLVYH